MRLEREQEARTRAARLRRFALLLAGYDALPKAPWTAAKRELHDAIVALLEQEGRIHHEGHIYLPDQLGESFLRVRAGRPHAG